MEGLAASNTDLEVALSAAKHAATEEVEGVKANAASQIEVRTSLATFLALTCHSNREGLMGLRDELLADKSRLEDQVATLQLQLKAAAAEAHDLSEIRAQHTQAHSCPKRPWMGTTNPSVCRI